jgi:hypothetical protein
MTEYPQLTYLGQAHFHQDYDLDAPAPVGIIANYLAPGENLPSGTELAQR